MTNSATNQDLVTLIIKCMLYKLVFKRIYNKNSFDNLVLHYHNYDREYNVLGKKDKYYSETLTLKGEIDFFNNLNFLWFWR